MIHLGEAEVDSSKHFAIISVCESFKIFYTLQSDDELQGRFGS